MRGMNTVTLGRTGLAVPQNGFGALPIQRIPKADAVRLLRRAFDGGMRFFDTARAYFLKLRMSLMLRRAPSSAWLTPAWQAEMAKIDNCINCRRCASRCPYGLDTPNLLRANLADYRRVLAGEVQT